MQPDKLRVLMPLAGSDLGDSGISVFVRALVAPLAHALFARGAELVLLGTPAELDAYGSRGVEAIALPQFLQAPAASVAWSLMAAGAHAAKLGAHAMYLPAANRRVVTATMPVVGTVHDLAQFRVPGKFDALRQTYITEVLTPRLRSLSRVLCPSEATAADVERFAKVPRERIAVVPNGVTLPDSAQLPVTSWRRPYLIYPSRLEHPGKNHLRLLQAYARSRAAETHDLLFSGKDWGAGAMIAREIESLGLAERAHVLGFLSREELASRMAGASGVVVAGLLEGFGLPAIEALALGKPVAVSRSGALPEVVGDLGITFDPYDLSEMIQALDLLVLDDRKRMRMQTDGPRHAARFSWSGAAEQIADALIASVSTSNARGGRHAA